MIPLELDEVEAFCPGRLERAAGATAVTGVVIDSRRVVAGDLFVAAGAGDSYVDDALGRGAAAALVPDDTFAALAELGRAVRDRSAATVVAITGSTGKTSTKDILAAICSPLRRTVAAEASYNNELGVPLTLCRLEPDTEVCIVELAMRGRGEIAALAEIARPSVAVITNVGPGSPRARRLPRGRGRGEGRARGCAAAERRRDRAGGLPSHTSGRRGRPPRAA